MLEVEMYKPFGKWLIDNSDMFMQEPLIPATACFDFIAFNSGLLIAYELKLSNAKAVIQQANMALLWCDHSYAVLPENKIHLGLKYKHLLCESVGLLSLNMEFDKVKPVIEPKLKRSHITVKRLRQSMINWMIRDWIFRHERSS